MRIWSLHPRHLDRVGLVAGWREALLAQAVLAERTRGYRHHPQLERFRTSADPLATIGAYLLGLKTEAGRRGYRFDETKIIQPLTLDETLTVTRGQLGFEWSHLGAKLRERSPELIAEWESAHPTPHPLFAQIDGDIEHWERTSS